jgi:hypothetical protein
MPLREALQTILIDYPKAKTQPLEGHPFARFIRGDMEGIHRCAAISAASA